MPVDGVGGILAKWFSNKHNVSVPTPYTFGQNPIPGVNLYRNTKAKFVMANGGNSLPVRWQNIMQKLDNLFI